MLFSTHYYVLSLGITTSALFEAFRDELIPVDNQGFPVIGLEVSPGEGRREILRRTVSQVDRCFAHYHASAPLTLVLVGTQEMQLAFDAVTAHGSMIIGRIEGDHGDTLARDLGRIVWPVVRRAISGVLERATGELRTCAAAGRVVAGLDAVVRAAGRGDPSTLLVEDDYHRRGSISASRRPPTLSPEVDVRDVFDDAVDAVIESVLGSGGSVVFMPRNALEKWERIVLLPPVALRPR